MIVIITPEMGKIKNPVNSPLLIKAVLRKKKHYTFSLTKF